MLRSGGPDLPFKSHDNEPTEMEMPASCLAEMKAKDKVTHTLLSGCPVSSLEKIIPCKSYRSVLDHVLKFVRALKKAVKDRQSHNEASPEEDIADSEQLQVFIKAEMMWIQESQQGLTEDRHFPTWKKQ